MDRDSIMEVHRNAGIGKAAPEYSIDRPVTAIFPFTNPYDRKTVVPALARIYPMSAVVGGKAKHHNVLLVCYGENEFFIQCEENFMEGKNTNPDPDEKARLAASHLPHDLKALSKLKKNRGTLKKSTGCQFWRLQDNEGAESVCQHCRQILLHIGSRFRAELDAIQHEFDAATKPPKPAMPSQNASLAYLLRKKPVLIGGEKGWGKTMASRNAADELDAQLIEIQGHEGVEALDLTGYYVRCGENYVWKDGRLSQAFRMAAAGKKALLLIDEILRIPQRQLSVLLSATSPYKGRYRLSTGRMVHEVDGVGVEETIECDVANLHIVATTNLGARYAVDTFDPALLERFLFLIMEPDVEELQEAVAVTAAARGIADSVVTQCIRFYEMMVQLKPQGSVNDVPNKRTLCEAVAKADDEAGVKEWMQHQLLNWVQLDVEGRPVPDQVKTVRETIERAFQ